MKKIIMSLMVLTLTFTFVGCGKDKSLYEHGLELVSLMEEMATSDSYMTLYSGNSELREVLKTVREGGYAEPKAVYKITIGEDILLSMTEMESMNGISEKLREYTIARLYAAFPTQMNGTGGANMIAAASICTANKTFVSNEVEGSILYLYTYEDAVPAMVTFTEGEAGAVSASSCFIFADDFKSNSKEELEQYFTELSVTVEEVEK